MVRVWPSGPEAASSHILFFFVLNLSLADAPRLNVGPCPGRCAGAGLDAERYLHPPWDAGRKCLPMCRAVSCVTLYGVGCVPLLQGRFGWRLQKRK